MDLFVSLPDTRESPKNLDLLYSSLESSSLPAPGTLNIVRTARVPIVKYIDSCGSGIRVDISMNNVSATASTHFIKHHLERSPMLRPLTMVLKQWLFQRKMNEVYNCGGLSSYALFLLVLEIAQDRHFESGFPEEAIGRYLFQFLRRWCDPNAFTNIIRPLRRYLDNSAVGWKDGHQPFSLCTCIR